MAPCRRDAHTCRQPSAGHADWQARPLRTAFLERFLKARFSARVCQALNTRRGEKGDPHGRLTGPRALGWCDGRIAHHEPPRADRPQVGAVGSSVAVEAPRGPPKDHRYGPPSASADQRRRAPVAAGSLVHVSAASTIRRQPLCSTATILVSLGLSRPVWACAACTVLNLSGPMVPSGPTRLIARHVAPALPLSGSAWRSSTS